MFDATVNIIGSLNVCEAAVAAGVKKVVFAGSGGTLYGSPTEIPTREGAPQHPESPYGVAKKAVGDYLHYYREVRGLEYTVLALANVYGPRQDPHGEAGVVAIFANQLLDRERPMIFGDGSQTRDFVYVDDVVDGFARARRQGRRSRAEHRHRHRDERAAALRRDGEARRLQGAGARTRRRGRARCSAARSIPAAPRSTSGWKPFTSLEEGAARTLEHFKGQRAAR